MTLMVLVESKAAWDDICFRNDETLDTAFAADTDNNGKLDSYTLYSINFRSPTRGPNGQFNRARNPLEARTLPMNGTSGGTCAITSETSASLISDSSWYKSGARLTKVSLSTPQQFRLNSPAGNP